MVERFRAGKSALCGACAGPHATDEHADGSRSDPWAGAVHGAGAVGGETTDLRATDNRGAGVLLFAVEGGDLNAVRLLLDKGVDVNARTTGEFSETRFGNLGPPPGFEPEKGVTALMVAAYSTKELETPAG